MTATAKTDLRKVQGAIRRVRPALAVRRIRPQASLVADLGVDSLALAELSIALEDAFGHPVFLGDILANIDDPAQITVRQLAEHAARTD